MIYVVKADGDAVVEHILGNESYEQSAHRLHFIDPVWKNRNKTINVGIMGNVISLSIVRGNEQYLSIILSEYRIS